MKIFAQSVPTKWEEWSGLPWDKTNDYFEVNRAANEAAVRALGYVGALTGELVRVGVCDGNATYMVMASAKGQLSLMHMDWVDGYQFQWAHRWTKKDILSMIERSKAIDKLFGR